MTVGELKEELENLEHEGRVDDNTEIRMAQQPRWAFEYGIGSSFATLKDKVNPHISVLYLEEGPQIGYLPSEAAVQLDW